MYDIITENNKEIQAFAQEHKLELLYITDKAQEKADCFFIDSSGSKNIRKEVQQAHRKFDLVVILGNASIGKNREILESSPDILLSPHFAAGKDFMKARNAGLDSVTCKIAAKNKVAIGIDFNEILHAREGEREVLLGRLMQNIKLCRKYRVRMLLASFASSVLEMRSALDLEAFAQSIGMTPKEAQEAMQEAGRILKRNEEKRSSSYVSEGIRVVE